MRNRQNYIGDNSQGAVQQQIDAAGGWDTVLTRIASGESVQDIARTLLRPDGIPIQPSAMIFSSTEIATGSATTPTVVLVGRIASKYSP